MYRKVELIPYTYFRSMEEVDNFLAINTLPEGFCKQLGELPDGTPVWARFEEETENRWVKDSEGWYDLVNHLVTMRVTAYVRNFDYLMEEFDRM